MNNIKNKRNLGFTLVELLVAMSIIGVLASIAVGSFRTSQLKGRDVERKTNLKQISNALEIFYADYGRYPDSTNGQIAACPYDPAGSTGTACNWGSGVFTDSKTVYFKQIPADPSSNQEYTYQIVSGSSNQKYKLFARLENSEDPECINSDCSQDPNFAVTSANTSVDE